MLVDRVLPVPEGAGGYPVPQLDGFLGCARRMLPRRDGDEGFASEGFAYEAHVDQYLYAVCEPFFEVAHLVGPRQAMNLILSRRNGDVMRNRIKAVQEIAALVPPYLKLREALAKDGFRLEIDPDRAERASVFRGTEFTGVCTELRGGKVLVGRWECELDDLAPDVVITAGGQAEGRPEERSVIWRLPGHDLADEAGVRQAVRQVVECRL